MSFYESDSDYIKKEKPNILDIDLLLTKYVGFNIVKIRKSASGKIK